MQININGEQVEVDDATGWRMLLAREEAAHRKTIRMLAMVADGRIPREALRVDEANHSWSLVEVPPAALCEQLSEQPAEQPADIGGEGG